MIKDLVDPEVGYRLHLLGLVEGAFEALPAYARTEEKLRRAVPHGLVTWSSAAEALGAGSAPDADRGWFNRRWEAGERDACASWLEKVNVFKNVVGWSKWAAGEGDVWLVVSPALRPLPALAVASRHVCVGPHASPWVTALGAMALQWEPRFPLDLDPVTRRFAALMAAGTTALEHVSGDELDLLLVDVVKHVLPPQHRADELARHVHRLVTRGLLDEPPGEIERTIHGLGRRRADRLHRAWQRGFFVPREGVRKSEPG